ncbi:cytochrome c oxidase subunit II [Aromatoleum aromaticum]|nr:cytochrome c oxidase subunit II [Aromatoleum aromaticum]NMG54947.1 cytochrome c oxidase subunit II [Aromatoleum aromaticum]
MRSAPAAALAVQSVLPVLAVPWLAACEGPQSILDPAGPAARDVTLLWWPMLIVATLVLVGVTVAWIVAMLRRPRDFSPNEAKRISRRWVVNGGILLPTASIVLLLGFGVPAADRMLPRRDEAPLRIDVTGRQWQWDVAYPGGGAVLVDELHLPAGRPVHLHVTSADVIHSFWVPRLGPKIDAVPGRTNVLRLQADEAGSLRGQCSEFCGTGHAHMVLKVQVHSEADFSAWLAERTATAPAGGDVPAGAAPGGALPAPAPPGAARDAPRLVAGAVFTP